MVDVKLISTGSKGNAILYESKILVDVGVSYKLLAPYIKDVEILNLTHSHADHLKLPVLKRLVRDLPNVAILCGIWLKPVLETIEMPSTVKIVYCEPNKWYKIDNMMFCPVSLYHDINNFGWRIVVNGQKIFHATDTVKLDGIRAEAYDLYAIEAHHITSVIDKQIEEKLSQGIFCYEVGSKNSHLSEEDCDKWIAENRGEHSEVIKLHYSNCYELVNGKLNFIGYPEKKKVDEQI